MKTQAPHGVDGAAGMLEMSSVVCGTPAEAIKHGGVDKALPLDRIAGEVVQLCR
jgi:two-component system chemotaxis response regulator CheB